MAKIMEVQTGDGLLIRVYYGLSGRPFLVIREGKEVAAGVYGGPGSDVVLATSDANYALTAPQSEEVEKLVKALWAPCGNCGMINHLESRKCRHCKISFIPLSETPLHERLANLRSNNGK